MKLYAGGAGLDEYEYALWANSKLEVAKILNWRDEFVNNKDYGFFEQKGKSLKAIIADKSKVYRRKLDDTSDWEIWLGIKERE